MTYAGIPRPAGAEREPAGKHDGKDLFQRRSIRGAKVGTADHLDGGIRKIFYCVMEVMREWNRIIIEEINPFGASSFDGGIALNGRLLAARNDDFKLTGRIIELA